jgi:hypothetical protein
MKISLVSEASCTFLVQSSVREAPSAMSAIPIDYFEPEEDRELAAIDPGATRVVVSKELPQSSGKNTVLVHAASVAAQNPPAFILGYVLRSC